MTFRASNVIPQTAYQTVKGAAVQLRLNVQAMVAHLAGNNATYDYLRGVYQTLKRANDQFTSLALTANGSNTVNFPAWDIEIADPS